MAAETLGMSEVERHLVNDTPPRVVELRTDGREPAVTHREPVGELARWVSVKPVSHGRFRSRRWRRAGAPDPTQV
jgi:hypothetical protein